MDVIIQHEWNLDGEQAQALQDELARKVIVTDAFKAEIRYIAGIDAWHSDELGRSFAAIVVVDAQTLKPIEQVTAITDCTFPYITGLLSFRELPPIIEAMKQLTIKPDLCICDGQGLAHPRRFGLACHLGVIYDIPAIGCGKTRLTGKFDTPAPERGAYSDLEIGQQVVGRALRTQYGINPLFISVGHRISLSTACDWIVHCAPQYRLPEPIRLADKLSREMQ
jgi:deoxyribonuclease V